MDIAFNINPLGLEGLGATLTSLIRNCSEPAALKIWFLCSDCDAYHKGCINDLLKKERFNGVIEFVDFDARKVFGHLRPLHGDWTGYGRLLIPDYINSDIVLYLDADLIVCIDVLLLKCFDFRGNFLAAVPGGKIKYALERNFLISSLKLNPELAYFNSGVLLINIPQWKALRIATKWNEIASQYPNDLLAIDQTLLNAVCKGRFASLPLNFNNAWCPGDLEPADADRSIIHFVGSPKPWDISGKTLHKGYNTWSFYNTSAWSQQFNKMSWNKIIRTWRIKNSILIKMKKKLKERS